MAIKDYQEWKMMAKNSSVISEQNKQNLLEIKFGGKKIKRGQDEPEVDVDDML